MGLAERRVAAAYQKDKFPGWKEKINAVAGYELAFEANIDELVKEGFLDSYPNTIDYNFFMPLENALKSICADDLGRDALKAKIKGIKITSSRSWCSLEVKIEGDRLHLDADPSYQRDDSAIGDYTKRITSVLESAL
ncbi:hypothetical protein [Hyalangium versicolor]|uniref:hypothetical protein n=1 Tax=Hyalangium versicolor TaxID=2861190 RepID=UPI001CCC1928|nr:hypothetical protein [Hyalangium versicolor]